MHHRKRLACRGQQPAGDAIIETKDLVDQLFAIDDLSPLLPKVLDAVLR
jgi:hypothetical protein